MVIDFKVKYLAIQVGMKLEAEPCAARTGENPGKAGTAPDSPDLIANYLPNRYLAWGTQITKVAAMPRFLQSHGGDAVFECGP